MQLDLGVTSGMPLRRILNLATLAERYGLNNVWLGEDITAAHEVFTVGSIVLRKSSKVNLGIGITSPLIRNISTIARASVSLSQIGGDNRFRLGLGVGGLQDLARLGIVVENPENLMRNAVTLLRRIWKGETVSFRNKHFTLMNYCTRHALTRQIPIFFGVRGPRLLKLAGEIADGAILSGPKTYIRKAINLVREGVKKSQKPTRNFHFVVWVPSILVEKRVDLNLVKRTVAFVLADTPEKVLEMAELDRGRVEKIKKTFQRLGIEKASLLVDEDLIEEIAIHGSAKEICQTLESIETLGVREVVFGPPYGAEPRKAITIIGQSWRRAS